MSTVMNVFEQLRNFLDETIGKCQYDENQQIIGFRARIESKLRLIDYKIVVDERGYTVCATVPVNADENTRFSVMEYITRINYTLRNGSFEMDLSDGEVRYKCYVLTKDLEKIPQTMIEESITLPVLMYSRYGDGLAALIMGFSDPITEIEKAESK